MIDSPEIISISLSLSKNFDGSSLKKNDVKFLIQDAKQQILRNYSDKNIIHIIIQNYKIDEANYKLLPEEIKCKSLAIDIIFICLPKTIVENLKKTFTKFDISIDKNFLH